MNGINQLALYHDSLDIADAVIEHLKASGCFRPSA